MMTELYKVLSLVILAASLAGADERVDALPEDDRHWLEEEVVYIITDVEREVFLNLETKEDRELFMEAFWEKRDPNPATRENEALVEHYRRLEYAIRMLGRDSSRPGWKTDRGRYYIILGPPDDIQRYDGLNEVVTIELWFYNAGDTRLGLPARFNLLFFKDNDIGEYQLYHPYADGPEALLHAGYGYRTNQNLAVDILETVSFDLARASLTIDMSEPTASMFSGRNTRDPMMLQVRPSMAVDRNLMAIEEYARNKVDTDYLDGYLRYGRSVSSDYSFNYVSSRSAFAVLFGPDNTPFVHYSIELDPEDFSLESDKDRGRFYTTLEVSLEVRNLEGYVLAAAQNVPFIQLTAGELEQAKALPFAYRDNFPILPGQYHVNVVLRNRATKEFTVAESEIFVPAVPDGPFLGDMVVSSGFEDHLDADPSDHKTFQVGEMELDPVTEHAFATDSTAYVGLQVFNATAEHLLRVSVLSSSEKTFHTEDIALEGAKTSAVRAALPLLKAEAGSYTVKAELVDPSGEVLGRCESTFDVSPRTAIGRAGVVYRHSFNADVPGLLDMTLGEQLMVRGRFDEAEERLRKAVVPENPQLSMAKWKLASALLFKRNADEALELLLPLKDDFPDQVEVVEGLGFSYYIKQSFDLALPYLEHARGLRPPDTSLLNALGDCYQRLQNPDKAREVFEMSLELNPEQAGVKARLAQLSQGG